MFFTIDDNKFSLVQLFEGSVTIDSITKFTYKEACKFYECAIEIRKHQEKNLAKLKNV